ncbi:MAG: hypothetical protein FWG83_03830 [Oscillospiraceae bacterium]|nr:hypothetical protein [Oscillospiraceae bacterium]
MGEVNARNSILIKALEDLDSRLYSKYKGKIQPAELNVVGGFALLMRKIRANPNEFTDLDYIGEDFSEDVKRIIDEVGIEYGLGTRWINNQVMLFDSTLADVETAVGKLRFSKSLELKTFTVNVLDLKGLLRMKVVAIDTQILIGATAKDYLRARDFRDVKEIMRKLGFSMRQLKEETGAYVLSDETFSLISSYILTGSNRLIPGIEDMKGETSESE